MLRHKGQVALVAAVMMMGAAAPASAREVVRYRVLRPGLWELWKVGARGKLYPDGGGTTSLDYIPLTVVYGHREGDLSLVPEHVCCPLLATLAVTTFNS